MCEMRLMVKGMPVVPKAIVLMLAFKEIKGDMHGNDSSTIPLYNY